MLVPTREFRTAGTPHWLSFIPSNPKGEAHPFTSKLTKRQVAQHSEVLRATARQAVHPVWPSLTEGCLIPVDDGPELFRKPATAGQEGDERADLLYVSAGDAGLALTFIEAKFRRYLKTARAASPRPSPLRTGWRITRTGSSRCPSIRRCFTARGCGRQCAQFCWQMS